MERCLTLAVYWVSNIDSQYDYGYRVKCYNGEDELSYESVLGPLRVTTVKDDYEDPDSDTGTSRGYKVTIEYVYRGSSIPYDAYPTRYSFERVGELLRRVDYIDLTRVNNMSGMFYGCHNFLGFYYHPVENPHQFEIGHQVTDTSYMFCDCHILRTSGSYNPKVNPDEELWLDMSEWNFDTRRVENMRGMFKGIRRCNHIIIPDTFNTVSVRDMSEMFYGCDSCKSLELPDNFNTSNVIDMSRMFTLYNYDYELENGRTGDRLKPSDVAFSALESLDLSMFDTAKVERMDYMFAGLYNLNDLNIDGFNTFNVRSMDYMFTYCNSLEELNLSGLHLAKVESLIYTFARCDGLTNLNMSHVSAPWLKYIKEWLFGCINLECIELDGFYTPSLTSMAHLFEDLTKLEYVDVSVLNTENVTDMSYMFKGCSALTSLDVSGFNTSNVERMDHMFDGCSQVEAIDVSSFDMENVKNIEYMFNGCNAITELDLSNFTPRALTSLENLFAGCNNITEIDLSRLPAQFGVESTRSMFSECYNLRTIRMCNLACDTIKDTSFMFFGCNNLEHIIDGALCTDNVTNMEHMFDGCFLLTAIPYITEYYMRPDPVKTTSNVTNMAYMFKECRALTSLDLSKFNTAHVETMEGMFDGCEMLDDLNLSAYYVENYDEIFYWDTSNVRNMAFMFRDCKKLEKICRYHLLHQLDTKNVETTESMFEGCGMLMSLGLPDGGFDLPNVRNTDRMFKGCGLLTDDGVIVDSLYHVVTMESMYEDCVSMQYISISLKIDKEWDTERFKNLRNIKNLCRNCERLERIYFCNLNLVNMNVDDIEGIFNDCYNLEEIHFDGLEYGKGSDQLIKLIEYLRDNLASRISLYMPDTKGEGLSSGNGLFKGFTELGYINLKNFNMTNMDDLSEMFMDCTELWQVYMEGCDASNIRYTDSMFENCTSLRHSSIEHLTLQRIASANKMFKNCSELIELQFNDGCMFEFLAVANEMFYGCENMSLLEIPNFDVRRIGTSFSQGRLETDMRDMFEGCLYLSTLKLNNFKINNDVSLRSDITVVTELGDYRFEYFFTMLDAGAPYLSYIEMRDFNNPRLTSMKGMFKNFANVRNIDLDNCNTENVTDMSEMFSGCSSLYSLNLSSFDTSKVTTMFEMFKGCSALSSLDLSNFDTREVTTMESMFDNTSALTHLNISSFDFTNVETLKKFLYFSGITTLDMSNFNTAGNVTDMSSMFTGCKKLTNLYNLDKFDTHSCTTMQMMFYSCSSLENLNVSNFITSNVTSMLNMFYGCSRLKTIDVSSFDTSKVRTFSDMFNGCSSLVELDLSNFRRSKALGASTNMYKQMFANCSNLNKLDISGLTGYASATNDLRQTFDGCTCLEYLDISNFREAGDMLYNGTNVFGKFGNNSVSGIINIGMLYMDTETCVLYAEKIWEDAISVSDTVNRVNIYVQDADPNECGRLFYDDAQPSKEKIKFIPYKREEEMMYLPATISSDSKLQWDEERREYYIIPLSGLTGVRTPTGVKEKIKMETCDTAMFVDFCDLQGDGKIQIAMKEKIEEESEK
jgi:surface protein